VNQAPRSWAKYNGRRYEKYKGRDNENYKGQRQWEVQGVEAMRSTRGTGNEKYDGRG
jgi:hypothetical protein